MSHFVVLVIGPDLDEQLAPYDENIEMPRSKVRKSPEDMARFIEHYSNPNPQADYEIKGVADAKAAGFYPVTEANLRGAWAALGEQWNGPCGWDEEGAFEWSTYNPQSKWDWWVIGGRWSPYFDLKPGGKGVIGDPDSMFTPRRLGGGKADQARKGDIDFVGMEAAVAVEAAKDWAAWEPLLELPMATSWSDFVARVEAKELSWEEAREQYHDQAQVVALQQAFPNVWSLKPEDFGPDREAYIQDRVQRSWVPFAMVHHGQWYEKGKMGWFGMSSDKPADQKPWAAEVRSVVLTLPEEELLTIVDCHI